MSANNGDHTPIALGTAGGNTSTRVVLSNGLDRAVTDDGKICFQKRPIPDDLLHPPGMVGGICDWVNDSAMYPQPVLTLGNALCLWGAVVGRKVASPTDLRTNMYIMGVAESGAGKDDSRKRIKSLVTTAGLVGNVLGGEDLASDSALLQSLKKRPSQLMQVDELGHLLAAWNSRNASTYQALIPSILMKAFTSSNTLFVGKEYADAKRPRIDIDQPNLCLYDTSVSENFYASLRRDQVEDGLLGRFLVIETNDQNPQRRKVEAVPPPVEIASWMRQWAERTDLPPAPPLAYEPGNLEALGLSPYSPIIVPTTGESEAVFDAFDFRCRGLRAKLRGQNGLNALWSRATEHAIKIALIIASGCGFSADELQITAEHASYATRLVEITTNNTCASVLKHVYENEYEKVVKHVLGTIRKCSEAGVSRSELLRKFQQIQSYGLDEIIGRLVESDQIIPRTLNPGPQGGRPRTVYHATGT